MAQDFSPAGHTLLASPRGATIGQGFPGRRAASERKAGTMNICILDAAPFQHPTAAVVRRTLLDHAAGHGWTPRSFFLPDIEITDCAGDFNCWLKTPGICSINDENREIARAVVQSDLLVFLTPVTFGGYASELKKGLDHIIQIISPFFETVAGESHHVKRYERYPRFVGLGLMDGVDDEAARVFRTLVARNALNAHDDRHASGPGRPVVPVVRGQPPRPGHSHAGAHRRPSLRRRTVIWSSRATVHGGRSVRVSRGEP